MTRLLLLSLFAVVLGAILIAVISTDAGYIVVSVFDTTVEMSFWFGVCVVVLLFLVIYYLFKFIGKIREVLAQSFSWISESRVKRIERRTNTGLTYFVEGNWLAAKKELLAAAKLDKKPLLQYIAAANSAFVLGEEEETRFLLQQAEKIAPENDRAILLTKARLEIRNQEYERALVTLQRANALYPDDPVILKFLKIVNIKLSNWTEVLDLLPRLKASKQIEQEELQALEVEAWNGQLDVALDKAAEMNTQPEATFEKIWKGVPSHIRRNPATVILYTQKLLKAGFIEKALDVITLALKQRWDSSLLWIYGNLDSSDKKYQFSQAESWLREHPDDPALLYVLGKLAKENELWGKAREYLEKSLAVKPSTQAYAELAGLLAQLGNHKESVECYRKGVLLPPT